MRRRSGATPLQRQFPMPTHEIAPRISMRGLEGGIGEFMEARRPAGAYVIPPVDRLFLVEAVSPGISVDKRWDRTGFRGVAPVGSLWLHRAHTRVDAVFHAPHAIRVLAVAPSLVDESFGTSVDFDRLFLDAFLDEQVSGALADLWRLSIAVPASATLARDEHLLEILVRLREVSGQEPQRARGGLSGQHARKATEMIADGADQTLRLSTLAQAVGLSPFHFVRAFKRTLGVSPKRFQKLVRLQRACELLRDKRLSILQVALAVGYGSGQALARVFRQELGISPETMRSQY
jgi:AraC family transcriptional regulator